MSLTFAERIVVGLFCIWFVITLSWFITQVFSDNVLRNMCFFNAFKTGNLFGKICIIIADILLLPWIIIYWLFKEVVSALIGIFVLIINLGGWKGQ